MTQKKKNTKENKIKDKPMSKNQKQNSNNKKNYNENKYGKFNDGKCCTKLFERKCYVQR